jgi:hypothetical protein
MWETLAAGLEVYSELKRTYAPGTDPMPAWAPSTAAIFAAIFFLMMPLFLYLFKAAVL